MEKLEIVIKFNTHSVKKKLYYPKEREIEINFKNLKSTVIVEQITVNGINCNTFYNTYFYHNDGRVSSSIKTITTPGNYILKIDDLYIRSHRCSNWHFSNKKEDFIFQYEFTNSSFVDTYRDRNHIGFSTPFIPCFGCSNTYGACQPATDTWPYLLSKKTGKNFLNLGVGGIGIDGIYNNLKLLYLQHPFNETIILFPNFDRRTVRLKIENLWIKLPWAVNVLKTKDPYHFFSNKLLQQKWYEIEKKIIEDKTHRYSKRFLERIFKFCEKNNIKLYCSSWVNETYEHLKQYNNFVLLPEFKKLESIPERADDGFHPHKRYFEYFVDLIYKNWLN